MKTCAVRSVGVLVVLLISCLALLAPAHAQSGKVEVLIWETDELDMPALFQAVADYVREYLGSVEVNAVSFDQYWDQLLARLTGGDPPDVFWVTSEMLRELEALGLVIPLDDAVRRIPGLLVSRQHQFGGL